MRRLEAFIASLEAIDFQHDKAFFFALTQVVKDIRQSPVDRLKTDFSALENLIFDRLGIRTLTRVNDYPVHDAGIYMPRLTNNHALVEEYRRLAGRGPSTYEALKRLKDLEFKGWVNHHRVKVGGVFSRITLTAEYSAVFFNSPTLSDEECAAIILHELGHGYFYFALLHLSVTTNLVLHYATEQLKDATRASVQMEILGQVEDLLDIKLDDKAGLRQGGSVFEFVVANEAVRTLRSELGSSTNDQATFEQLADFFSVRHGAGRHLATALDKIGGTRNGRRRTVFTAILNAIGDTFEVIKHLGLLHFGVVRQLLTDPVADAYDPPKVRLQRIREQLLTALKQRHLTPLRKQELLTDVAVVEELIKDLEVNYNFIQKLWLTLSPRGRRQGKQIVFQRELETLLANPLFAHAAKFDTLT